MNSKIGQSRDQTVSTIDEREEIRFLRRVLLSETATVVRLLD